MRLVLPIIFKKKIDSAQKIIRIIICFSSFYFFIISLAIVDTEQLEQRSLIARSDNEYTIGYRASIPTTQFVPAQNTPGARWMHTLLSNRVESFGSRYRRRKQCKAEERDIRSFVDGGHCHIYVWSILSRALRQRVHKGKR